MNNASTTTARLVVRLGAIAENYCHFVGMASPAQAAGVVKADAYGLGMAQIAPALLRAGCDTFFVARMEEGIALRVLLPDARIFVLDGVSPDTASAFIEHRLIPILNSLAQIATWSDSARARHTTLECCVHIDTGMNRLGLPPDELAVLSAESARLLAHLNVVLWMSHLACGDDPDSPMNAVQLERFRAALAALPPAPASLSASGGALLGRDYAFDLIRPGIGLYGGNPLVRGPNPMRPAVVLTAKILQLRRVDRGETVGYGATFLTGRPSTLATLGLGYADGLMRAIGNNGHGAIAGTRAPVVGRVSMDLITLDVTDVAPDALRVGAEAEFFGDSISLEEFAGNAGTVNYEVLTRLGSRMQRDYEAAA
jgi:alanine racemase